MRISVIGLGRMGRILARHLLSDGHDVTVWNRSPEAADDLVTLGARRAESVAEAVAGAETIVTVLFGPQTVREVIVESGLTFEAGALWIDVTTISPSHATDFAGRADAQGIRYVHAPVLGTLAPARARALGVLLGGRPADVEAATSVTSSWADPDRVHRFDTPAEAAAGKLAVNLGLAVATQGLAEAIRVGAGGGLSLESVLALLDKTPLAGIVAAKGATLMAGTKNPAAFDDAQFTVDAFLKDAGLMAGSTSVELPALAAAAQSLRAAQRAGRGGQDFSVIASSDE